MSGLTGFRPGRPFVCLALSAALTAITHAQVPGRNVNMVSGTGWPDGDPFLQRQNEPSVAVSSRNPMHLLAGANDYRTVDLPGLPDDLVTGDAWLGVFASYDGGATWRSTLLPGYPQDLAATPPLWGYEAGADPTVRAGTHGLFYYSGIAFDRANPVITAKVERPTSRTTLAGVDGATSAVFVARFIDNNHQENANPIAYLNTVVVADNVANSLVFLDKPWMAVDRPRKDAGTCEITQELNGEIVTQSIPAGIVYIAYSQFEGTGNEVVGQIMFTRSVDCGVTWSAPIAISGPHHINQGATIAIDPKKGAVHIAWRRFAWPRLPEAPTEDDAILIAHSFDAGLTFTAPEVVAEFEPFDQGTGDRRFRTNAYPTVTVDRKSRVFVAFASRDPHPGGDARVVVTQARRPSDTTAWPTPVPVDLDIARRGHQIMPTAAASGDRLQIAYVDLQEDHTWALHARDGDGYWYETRVISAERTSSPNNVFNAVIDDSTVVFRRHTADIWVAQATIADQPAFLTRRVSDYRVGSHPDRTQQIEQLQFNPPNLPLFRQGTAPFWGDYIDIGALAFVPKKAADKKDRWEPPNTTDASYVVFTDNRDVRPPADNLSCDVYTPPLYSALDPTESLHDPNTAPPPCDPAFSERTGMRNQNIYLARVTQGLFVGIPGNAKPLGQIQRAFVIFVENTTYEVKTFRISIPLQPDGGSASFDQFSLLTAIEVAIAPRSSVSRTFFVTAPDPKASVDILVQQTVNGVVLPVDQGGLEGTATVNPDMINPNMINPNMINPDMINVDVLTTEVHTPNMINPDMINFEPAHPNMINPDMINPDMINFDVVTPDMINPDMINFQADNPNMINPNMINPNMINPNMINPNMINGAVTDAMWKITNVGNTTSAYDIRLALRNTTVPEAFWTQLILHKTYLTPSAKDCQLLEEYHNVLIAAIDQPQLDQLGDPIAYDPTDSSVQHATIWLAPGESGWITFRVIDPDKHDDVTFDPRTSVESTVLAQAVNSDDAAGGETEGDTATSSSILFLDRPRRTPVGAVMEAVRVLVQDDATGDPVGGEPVTLTLAVNPGGATLHGAAATTDSGGIATFNSLWLDRIGTGYQLLAATATGTSDRSAPFDITGFKVTSLADSGPGTLRNAIEIANATVGEPDAIAFEIPGGGPHVIAPTSPLPPITDDLIIDGTTQPGYSGVPLVRIDGSGAGAGTVGLEVQSTTATIRGLAITSFDLTGVRLENAVNSAVEQSYVGTDGTADLGNGDHGIRIRGGSGTRVRACVVSGNNRDGIWFWATTDAEVTASRIGTTADGSIALPNTWTGVLITSSSFVRIGTGAPGAGNVISGNAILGIEVTESGTDASNLLFAGNRIGTDVSGTIAVPNGAAGIAIYGNGGTKEDITIGGPTPDFRNIISGNTSHGIQLNDTDRVAVLGNYVGLTSDGAPLGNGFVGVQVTTTADTIIGTAAAGNVISSNGTYGIEISGTGGSPVTVQGNKIGTDPTGTAARGNLGPGIRINNSAANIIGGTTPGEGNLISGNMVGILISASSALGNTVQGNLIGTNADGTASLGSQNTGIAVWENADNTLIGGITPGSGNVISGNMIGLDLQADGAMVTGNLIGTDGTGSTAVPNTLWGVRVASSNTRIGGSTAQERNVISGNDVTGVIVEGPAGSGALIQGNYVGTDETGFKPLPNGSFGIYLFQSSDNTVGGLGPGQGNLVSGNGSTGIVVNGSVSGTLIAGNRVGTSAAGDGPLGNGGNGITILGSSVVDATVRENLVSANAADGIEMTGGPSGVSVLGNIIGLSLGGIAPLGNGESGVSIRSASHDNIIGAPGEGNVISGNDRHGIDLYQSPDNVIRSNWIGTNRADAASVGNFGHGILVGDSPGSQIGGEVLGEGNVISANGNTGVYIVGGSSSGNVIVGNLVGTDSTGTLDLGNGVGGVTLSYAPNNTVGGVTPGSRNVISGNPNGVTLRLALATGNVVQGNYIGPDINGTGSIDNAGTGVLLDFSAHNNRIGGTSAAERNVISGNERAFQFAGGAHDNLVQGNYIGTTENGLSALPNRSGIVIASSPDNTIGGSIPGAGNVISGNTLSGVWISGTEGGNVVQGNFIGPDAILSGAIPNGSNGVQLSADGNVVGGTTEEARNVISGNGSSGVQIYFGGSNNVVQGNLIGLLPDGMGPLGNGLAGVAISGGASDNIIGGAGLSTGNEIRYNARGVVLTSDAGTGNTIVRNRISDNTGLGIDLGYNGPTPNDPGDSDTGANNLQNFPSVEAVVLNAGVGETQVTLSLDSAASTSFSVEVFSTAACDAVGYGEGQDLLGTTTLVTDSGGLANASVTFSGLVPAGSSITATATDPDGNTSEFSACREVPPPTVILDTFDPGGTFHPENNLAAAGGESNPPLSSWAMRLAVQFPVTGSDYRLMSITLPISFQGSDPGTLRVRLTRDAGGYPGALLELLSEDDPTWPPFSNPFSTTTTLASAANPLLLDGETYWIVTELTTFPTGHADYRWFDTEFGMSLPILQQQDVTGSLPSDPWTGAHSATVPVALRVEGVAVP